MDNYYQIIKNHQGDLIPLQYTNLQMKTRQILQMISF